MSTKWHKLAYLLFVVALIAFLSTTVALADSTDDQRIVEPDGIPPVDTYGVVYAKNGVAHVNYFLLIDSSWSWSYPPFGDDHVYLYQYPGTFHINYKLPRSMSHTSLPVWN